MSEIRMSVVSPFHIYEREREREAMIIRRVGPHVTFGPPINGLGNFFRLPKMPLLNFCMSDTRHYSSIAYT